MEIQIIFTFNGMFQCSVRENLKVEIKILKTNVIFS